MKMPKWSRRNVFVALTFSLAFIVGYLASTELQSPATVYYTGIIAEVARAQMIPYHTPSATLRTVSPTPIPGVEQNVTENRGIEQIFASSRLATGYEDSSSHKPENATSSIVQRTQAERTARVRQACLEMGFSLSHNHSVADLLFLFPSVSVLPKYQLLSCSIPKVASTSWKRLLLALHGYPEYLKLANSTANSQVPFGAHEFAGHVLTKLSSLSREPANDALTEYTRVLFVRSPYSRILSAYRDKIERYMYSGTGSEWSSLVSNWFAENNLQMQAPYPNITFSEFVTYYTKTKNKDIHWEDMRKLCHPCLINYSVIIHYETLKEDLDYLLDQVHAPSDIRLPDPFSWTASSKEETLRNYYSQLSDMQLEELANSDGVKKDNMLFGYEIPAVIKRGSPK